MGSECILTNLLHLKMTEIVFRDAGGSFPQCDLLDQVAAFGVFSIGTFKSGGTGFVVKLLPDSCALVLTAAHIFVEGFKFAPNQSKFKIGRNKYHAFPLRSHLDMTDDMEKIHEPISGNLSSIPDDWMLCKLEQRPGKLYSNNLVPLELENLMASIAKGLAVSIIGLPKHIYASDMGYVAPSEPVSELTSIKKCLCGGGKVVRSDGFVMNIGEALAISCCTANGMSGSPLLVESYGKFKVIGILHGGPISDLHYLCAKIAAESLDVDKLIQELIN